LGPVWRFPDAHCPRSQAEATCVARLSQGDAGISPVSGAWTRRSMSSWIALPDCLPARSSGSQSGSAAGAWPTSIRTGVLHGRLDGSGHGLLAKFLGQFADLGFGVAAVAAERLQEG
jgi:hypothetical protein